MITGDQMFDFPSFVASCLHISDLSAVFRPANRFVHAKNERQLHAAAE